MARAGQRLNPALRRYLREWRLGDLDEVRAQVMAQEQPEVTTAEPSTRRLSDADRQAIIEGFLAGTTRERLAADYSVSLSAVKWLLRKAGVRRPRWPKRST